VPFGTFQWQSTEEPWKWEWDLRVEPEVRLRQEGADSFVLLQSFCYVVPKEFDDAGDVYVISGADGPDITETRKESYKGHHVLFPPNLNVREPAVPKGATDLASVPWFMWWLIATYGNHTRAALLHDSLYVDEGEPPVPRADADRLLLMSLHDPKKAKGVFRHWLMWAAVSVFGTMGKWPGLIFGAHVYAFWGLLLGAIGWRWGSDIWALGPRLLPGDFSLPPVLAVIANVLFVAALILAVIALLALLLGGAWRAGRDNTGGWAIALALLAVVIGALIALEWPLPLKFEWSPLNMLFAALALLLLGVLWGFGVHHSLRGWLWPTALIGLPIALIPVGLIFIAVFLVRAIDEGAARVRARQKNDQGERIGYQKPEIKPTRTPI
jgi:hypothetical protein